MRQKTINGEYNEKIKVQKNGKNVYICIHDKADGYYADVILNPKNLRKLGEACIQMADELEAAK